MTDRSTQGLATEPFGEFPAEAADLDEAAAALGSLDESLDPIETVRERLQIEASVPDVTIAASLAQIAARGDTRDRWLAAFGSPLGKHLALRGSDLNTALNVVLALAPRHQG